METAALGPWAYKYISTEKWLRFLNTLLDLYSPSTVWSAAEQMLIIKYGEWKYLVLVLVRVTCSRGFKAEKANGVQVFLRGDSFLPFLH